MSYSQFVGKVERMIAGFTAQGVRVVKLRSTSPRWSRGAISTAMRSTPGAALLMAPC